MTLYLLRIKAQLKVLSILAVLMVLFQNLTPKPETPDLSLTRQNIKNLSDNYWINYQARRIAESQIREFIKPSSVTSGSKTIADLIQQENISEQQLITAILDCRHKFSKEKCPAPPRILSKGINMGNRYRLYWPGFYLDKATRKVHPKEEYTIRSIKTVGFHHIRIPIELDTYYSPETGINKDYLTMLDDVIDLARKQRLKVVLVPIAFKWNFNKQTYFPENATLEQKKQIVEKRFRGFWNIMANHYKNHSNDLIFELTNEPTAYKDNSFTASEINLINYSVYYNIRKYYPQRPMVLFPAVAPSTKWYEPDYVLQAMAYFLPGKVLNDPRLVLTFHYYQPHDFTDQHAYARADKKSWSETKISFSDSAETQATVKSYFQGVKDQARLKGIDEVWIGEFGTYCAAPTHERIAYNKVVTEVAQELGLAWALWSLNAGGPKSSTDFGIYNSNYADVSNGIYGLWHKEMLASVLPGINELDATNKYIKLGSSEEFNSNLICIDKEASP